MSLRSEPSNELSEELIQNYQDYLRKIAYFVKITLPDNIEIDDLVQYGEIGLIEAARKFDPKLGVSFKTYSYYRIRGAIYDGLRTMGLFKAKQYKNHVMRQKINDLMMQETNNVNINSDTCRNDDSVERLRDIFSSVATLITLSYASYMDHEVQNGNDDINKELITEETKSLIMKAIEQLSHKERNVVKLYYFDELTFEDIGKEMGLSKSWISRVHLQAINKLKQKLKQSNITTY